MARIFVTGGTGFVGARVLPRLTARGHDVVAVRRAPANGLDGDCPVTWVTADLKGPGDWQAAMEPSDIVLHLAALTGKAAKSAHRRDNLELTERLLEAGKRIGVSRFVFVSSIVAKTPDRSKYPYAQAKADAEARVRASGIPFLILRPTTVMGAGSANLDGFKKLACAPVIPVFGDGRSRVQPIDVDDLADLIAEAVDTARFDGASFDLGGPEVITTEALLQAIRGIVRGGRGPVLHLPVTPIMTGLWWLEHLVGAGLLPLTAGQLSMFRWDTTIELNPLVEAAQGRMCGVESMLRSSFGK